MSLLIFVSLAKPAVKAAAAKPASPSPLITLPLTGTTTVGATFSGTLTINHVVRDRAGLFVDGVVTGHISATPNTTTPGTRLTFVAARLPLTVSGPSGPIAMTSGLRGRIVLAQTTCGVLSLMISGINLNFAGVVVMTSPITIDVSGDSAGAVGSLVCSILNLVGGLGNLLNLLTSLLGALGGLGGGGTPTV
jgi:hypothetical protein